MQDSDDPALRSIVIGKITRRGVSRGAGLGLCLL